MTYAAESFIDTGAVAKIVKPTVFATLRSPARDMRTIREVIKSARLQNADRVTQSATIATALRVNPDSGPDTLDACVAFLRAARAR